jgi:3-phenylpropionate/trans-cinnamate dioxygenase ferredoxin subunit
MIIDVGATDEFVPGTPQVCDINGREVVVVSTGGEWFGVRNICPHQTETLALGLVRPEIKTGDGIGRYRVTDRMLIACPRHVWGFDLKTGHCVVDPTLRVRAYTVYEHDGRVLVDDGRAEPPTNQDKQTARRTASTTH